MYMSIYRHVRGVHRPIGGCPPTAGLKQLFHIHRPMAFSNELSIKVIYLNQLVDLNIYSIGKQLIGIQLVITLKNIILTNASQPLASTSYYLTHNVVSKNRQWLDLTQNGLQNSQPSHFEYAQTFRVASSMKVTKYDAPPSDRFGMGPHTSKCTKSSGLDSRDMHVGWGIDVCFPYWQCSQN